MSNPVELLTCVLQAKPRPKPVPVLPVFFTFQDAANGDFRSAASTLSTAMTLIRQSKVGSDDRCRLLIDTLQVDRN